MIAFTLGVGVVEIFAIHTDLERREEWGEIAAWQIGQGETDVCPYLESSLRGIVVWDEHKS